MFYFSWSDSAHVIVNLCAIFLELAVITGVLFLIFWIINSVNLSFSKSKIIIKLKNIFKKLCIGFSLLASLILAFIFFLFFVERLYYVFRGFF